MSHKKWSGLFVSIAVILAGISLCAPSYLSYSDIPKKSSAIILLSGPDFEDRKKEANDLIGQGLADYLVIPAFNKILKVAKENKLVPFDCPSSHETNIFRKKVHRQAFYEDTQNEIQDAKTIIDDCGFRSAIIVSSPYHMRRVKIISERIFNGTKYKLYFVPTHYENRHGLSWFLHSYDLKWVAKEYSKITWFFLYRVFQAM